MEIVQPAAKSSETLSTHEILYQDIQGSAWFDNIAIWQVPRVMVTTQTPYNLLRSPEQPKLRANVQDLTGQALLAVLILRDGSGRVVDRMSQRVGEGAPMNVTWEPRIDKFGWYTAELVLIDQLAAKEPQGQTTSLAVARDVCDFLYLPHERSLLPEESPRFLLDATPSVPSDTTIVPQMLELTGMGGAIISSFPPLMPRSELPARRS
ncbi:MAG: hypothetical protein HC898_07150, partial [Phycisphaerales bacterium]|nr:hypothetical protein [Phycisphaerales bacterium]